MLDSWISPYSCCLMTIANRHWGTNHHCTAVDTATHCDDQAAVDHQLNNGLSGEVSEHISDPLSSSTSIDWGMYGSKFSSNFFYRKSNTCTSNGATYIWRRLLCLKLPCVQRHIGGSCILSTSLRNQPLLKSFCPFKRVTLHQFL